MEILAIDMMNYPIQTREVVDYNFNDYPEWIHMAQTTFKPMLPMGRFPRTDSEIAEHKHLQGSMFVPYDTVADLVRAMDEIGYDRLMITAAKIWSLKNHRPVWDFTVDQVQAVVEKGKGRLLGGAGYNPFDIDGSLREIERAVKEYGFRYVYFHSLSYGLAPNDKRYYPLYAKCSELNIAVGMQTGHSAEPMPSWCGQPMYLDEIAITFPKLRINLSHTGWPWFREWCDLAWKHPNVYGDISAYMPKSLEPHQIDFMFSGKGKRKVMWGTNGMGLMRGKRELLEMGAKDDVKAFILRENALRFLGL